MPYYESDNKGGVMPVKGDIPEDAIREIERADDETIVRSMTSGIASDVYIYRYTISTATGPKEIIGISTEGAYALANEMRNIEVLNNPSVSDVEDDKDYVYVIVRARNTLTNVTLAGVGRACKYIVGKNNEPITSRNDDHAFVKAFSKAQRNAILHHTSENVVQAIIEWAKKGKSARLGPPAVQMGAKPPQPPAPAGQKPAPPPAAQKTAAQPATKPAMPAEAVIPPATYKQPPAPPLDAEAIAKQREKLNSLRTQVYDRMTKELNWDEAAITSVVEQRFKINTGLSGLNEAQLNECLGLIDASLEKMAQQSVDEQPTGEQVEETTTQPPPPPPVDETTESKAKRLGFANLAERATIRGRLFTLLTNANYLAMTTEQAKAWVANNYGLASSGDADKETLHGMIKDATDAIEALKNPKTDSQPPLV